MHWGDRRGHEGTQGTEATAKVRFYNNQVTDEGLKHLKNLKNLEDLELFNLQVADKGLLELGEMKSLRRLVLAGTDFTGEGLLRLKGLKLRELYLFPYQITDAVLASLREIGMLHMLSQAKGKGDLRPDQAMDVVSLNLGQTKVTDRGLKELGELKNLERLILTSALTTGEGLRELKVFKKLNVLGIYQGDITDSVLKTLRRSASFTLLTWPARGIINNQRPPPRSQA